MTTGAAGPARAMTLEEWAALDEEVEGELVDGILEEEERPTFLHEIVVAWLIRPLHTWARRRRGLVASSETKIAVGPRRGRKPDVSVYLPGRVPPSRTRSSACRRTSRWRSPLRAPETCGATASRSSATTRARVPPFIVGEVAPHAETRRGDRTCTRSSRGWTRGMKTERTPTRLNTRSARAPKSRSWSSTLRPRMATNWPL